MNVHPQRSTEFEVWIATARAVPIDDELARRGIHLKRQGKELVGPCPRCGGTDRFGVNISKQIWNCRLCDKGGDVIDLVQHLDGCTFLEAIKTLTGEVPLEGRDRDPKRERRLAQMHEQIEREKERRKAEARRDAVRQRDKARWMWRTAGPADGTLVETYLRSRGITVPLPSTVRFLPPNRPDHHPAMLVPYMIADEPEPGILDVAVEKITAVHLTLLKPDGSGKADVEKPKITVAQPAGRPLMLAPMNDLMGLTITEGIEDALSVHQATGLGAWAAGSAVYLPRLVAAIKALATREYDASPDCITIFVDGDDAGQRHAHALAAGLTELSGKLAAAITSPTSTHFEILLREAT
jgi:putative DNA primase/helicase